MKPKKLNPHAPEPMRHIPVDDELIRSVNDRKWKTVSSEYLVERPWLTARHDVAELPNGNRVPEYYVLEYPDWVNVIAVTTEGEFVIIDQYRYGLGVLSHELVAGCLEEGETPLEAARRELLEETGYAGGKWNLLMTIAPNPSTSDNLTFCYLADGVEKVSGQHLDTGEDISVRLVSAEKLLSMMTEGKICQALMLAPLWKYFYDRKQLK